MVSVVVPVLDAAKYLDECISSILNQSYSDLELLLFVGKCTDNSREICERWMKDDSRVKIYDQIKVGPGGARNQGIDTASGKYIYFCDADDYLVPDCLKIFVETAEAEDADIVESNYWELTWLNEKWNAERYGCMFWAINLGHDTVERYAGPAVWKYFSKLSLWKDNNIRFADILTAMDDLAAYSLLFSTAKKSVFLLNNLYCYRVIPGSLSRTASKQRRRFENLFTICDYLSEEYSKRGLYESCRLTLANQIECHSRMIIQAIPDVSGDEHEELCVRIRDKIKDSFKVNTTIFDIGVLGVGSSLVEKLQREIGCCPTRRNVYFPKISIYGLNDSQLAEVSGAVTDNNTNLILLDFINEINNLTMVSDMEIHLKEWKDKFCTFVNRLSEKSVDDLKVVVLENYFCLVDSQEKMVLFDNHEDLLFYNEVLSLYYGIAREVLGEACFIPAAPSQLMFSNEHNPETSNTAVSVYFMRALLDSIR